MKMRAEKFLIEIYSEIFVEEEKSILILARDIWMFSTSLTFAKHEHVCTYM